MPMGVAIELHTFVILTLVENFLGRHQTPIPVLSSQ